MSFHKIGAIIIGLFLPSMLMAANPEQPIMPDYYIQYINEGTKGGSILGRVFDRETREPLKAVSIQIDWFCVGTITDNQGEFIIENIPDGRIILWISMVGYETLEVRDIDIQSNQTVIISASLLPIVVPLGKDVIVKGARKKVQFTNGSRPRYHFPDMRRLSPQITVDYEPGVPLYNVIPVSEITVIMEDPALPQWPPVSHLIPRTGSSTTSDLTRESLAFDTTNYWWKRRVARVVDASLPIIDEIDRRRIAVELQGITATVKDQTVKK